ncbi:3-phenylpropionate/trans-cinnamate dioxygenase ferredoxin reductase subunit [Kibdelosporangium aridum]|uniref:3-phenylpropionate/trans-cinnamate dioxygenase ferredoxin reductase subunit n=1 Tax=Kibdelosporangium aridum TaxID=2030 RepID=A0A1Y5Y260_KIBAR|nr:3-phenylpropionate/trans-cinnamate dioxygenase ferredoxin reductase subunit [Kibdelosporangium aridum]
MTTFVIVGGGLAGAKAAEALRDQGFDGDIVLVTEEQDRPYERPPLSKDYLQGKAERDSAFVHGPNWYDENNVDLRLGVAATAIDRAAHQVRLADGSSVEYAKLLLATGSSPRQFPGAEDALYLRKIGDSERIKSVIANSSRLIVIGAGWIGLEVTAAARAAGVEVTVLEAAPQPLITAIGSEVAEVYADLHRANGVDLRLGVEVDQVGAKSVGLVDGTVVDADAVLVAIGAAPNVSLAKDAGLDVDNGVLVDASLRTSDPDIFAAGDIANAENPFLSKRVRVEHWANALNQPAVAATGMLGGSATYDELPYFYTDQYDLGMEYIGDIAGYDRVVFRGDKPGREFIAFWLKDNRVLAGMNVNIWDVVDPIKALIRSRKQVDPDRLANPDIPLEEQ